MHKIRASETLELQLVVTGAHLLPEFGLTVDEIVGDGFTINQSIPEISSASSGRDVAYQVGAGVVAFSDAFDTLKPDAVVLLGDRYELLPAAIAAFFLHVPIVHLHGGEVTNGAFDDAIRHTISRFARIHAVAAPAYANRLIRAGEHPDSVHMVGGLGVDSLEGIQRYPREDLENELGILLRGTLILVTYHPVTAAEHDTKEEISSLVSALEALPDVTVIFTLPNADPEHGVIVHAVREAVATNQKWHLFSSLGSRKYLSLLSHASVVVGNSSSGLMEAPSLGIPTVNIGPRQDGRLRASSVLSCGVGQSEIEEALTLALSPLFRESLGMVVSPYGTPGAANRVLKILESTALDSLGPKEYFDPPENK
jgi:GDP/UDP-N,N'-diacetylbacillosamine 2-epimerase (hydrolysing)